MSNKKSQERIKSGGEVFTPLYLVREMIDKIVKDSPDVLNPGKTYLDNSCGNGQFLIEVLRRKIKHNDPLSTIYGVDLMADNVCDTIARLIIYTKIGEDIFNENGTPKPDLSHEGYHDQHNFDWLRKHKISRDYTFKRRYRITVRNKETEWWLFEYKYGKERKWTPVKNIICADALRYHYRFDNTFPYDGEEQKRKTKEKQDEIWQY